MARKRFTRVMASASSLRAVAAARAERERLDQLIERQSPYHHENHYARRRPKSSTSSDVRSDVLFGLPPPPRGAGASAQSTDTAFAMASSMIREHEEAQANLKKQNKELDRLRLRCCELEKQLTKATKPKAVGVVPSSAPRLSASASTSSIGPSEDSGHVFVLHCSVTGFAGDALLLPCLPGKDVPEGVELVKNGNIRHYHGRIGTKYFTDATSASEGTMKCVDAFLKAAGSALKGARSALGRAKPLLALPIPGVGNMDERDLIKEEGLIIEAILAKAYAAAQVHGVDVAVCTVSLRSFRVAQVLRERCCPFERGPFWMLSAEQIQACLRLKASAFDNKLSLFMGAGVSFPSGLPSWQGLLQELALKAGYDKSERAALDKLDFLDQPSLIREKLGGEGPFKKAVAACVQEGKYTPAHAILSTLQVASITTNYDDLFEEACGTCPPKL